MILNYLQNLLLRSKTQTVGSYLLHHPDVNEFWLQAGRSIFRHDVKKDLYGWKKYKKEPILRIEHLDGEPVVLHIKPNHIN